MRDNKDLSVETDPMRVTSDFWVSSYIRLRNDRNRPTVLMKRGAKEAGAIFIRLDRLDGSYDLFQPASQLSYDEAALTTGERLFSCKLEKVDVFAVMDALEAEQKFDSDLWIVETECADGSHDLALVTED